VETLLTVRRVFEPAAAALAAKVASDEALQSIADAYARMEAAKTADELLEPDLAFHRRIAEATRNDLLAYIGNMLSLALRESIKLSSRLPNTHALSLPRHKAILTALLNRDPLAAHQATLVQLKETREDLGMILHAGLDLADGSRLAEPDLAFHRRIAEATNNDLLAYIGNMLSLALRESIKLSSRHPNTHALSLPRHKAILTALLNRDPLAAQQATLVQLKETRDDISAVLESGSGLI